MTRSQEIAMSELEHRLYHILVPLLETHLDMDPCPAIKLANEIAAAAVRDMRASADRADVEATKERIREIKEALRRLWMRKER